MRDRGFYCPECGETERTLPSGAVNCHWCGSSGLRCHIHKPRRILCPVDLCTLYCWDDGVNDDLDRHLQVVHSEFYNAVYQIILRDIGVVRRGFWRKVMDAAGCSEVKARMVCKQYGYNQSTGKRGAA